MENKVDKVLEDVLVKDTYYTENLIESAIDELQERFVGEEDEIDDIIAEIADNNIPIYTYDLLQYASNNFDLIQPSDLQGDEPSVTSIIQANIYEILTEELYAYVTTIQDNKKENEKE